MDNVIAVTSRNPDSRDFTVQQLHDFGFPPGEIFFTMIKDSVILEYIHDKSYSQIFFADDRDDNTRNVLRNCPGVSVYRISPKLEYRKKNYQPSYAGILPYFLGTLESYWFNKNG